MTPISVGATAVCRNRGYQIWRLKCVHSLFVSTICLVHSRRGTSLSALPLCESIIGVCGLCMHAEPLKCLKIKILHALQYSTHTDVEYLVFLVRCCFSFRNESALWWGTPWNAYTFHATTWGLEWFKKCSEVDGSGKLAWTHGSDPVHHVLVDCQCVYGNGLLPVFKLSL